MLRNVPDELKNYRQFVCWQYQIVNNEKKKVPVSPLTGTMASVNDPSTWGAFEHAVRACESARLNGIGFVITPNDPYTFIDLDVPHNEDERTAQLRIYENFNTYAEISPSGQGLHIIARGGVPTGKRRGSIEVYSSQRYMTVTGNVFRNVPIADCQYLLDQLYSELNNSNSCVNAATDIGIIASYSPAVGLPPEYAAQCKAVWELAAKSANGHKFQTLWAGHWQGNYPSQSEADMALMNILAFHTRDVDVLKGLFRQSALGQRAKAMREEYLSYTIRRSFDLIVKPVEIIGEPTFREDTLEKLNSEAQTYLPEGRFPTEFKRIAIRDLPALPGIVHEVASYMYQSSRNPSADFALVGALALMAGICGKAFNVSDSGLNLYLLMLAKTGTGKGTIETSINSIMNAVAKGTSDFELRQTDAVLAPAIREFVSTGDFASVQGMRNAILAKPSCVFIKDEFGQALDKWCGRRASQNDTAIKDLILILHGAGGAGTIVDGITYSDTSRNTAPLLAPAMSILGLSTPARIFRTLTAEDIEDGFLPRFIIVEKLDEVQYNLKKGKINPSKNLISYLAQLVEVVKARHNHAVQHVEFEEDAEALSAEYMFWCGKQIAHASSGIGELWNRAHLNAIRIAALLAVGINYHRPVINLAQMRWAIDFINSCVYGMIDKFDVFSTASADTHIGTTESKCVAVVNKLLKAYVGIQGKPNKYKFNKAHHAQGIISKLYISRNVLSSAAFQRESAQGRGAGYKALSDIITRLMQEGVLIKVSAESARMQFDATGELYQINRDNL